MSSPHRTRPVTVFLTLIALVSVVLLGGIGVATAATPAPTLQATTTTVTVTPSIRGYGTTSVAKAVVRDSAHHARAGKIAFYVGSTLVSTVTLSAGGTASTTIAGTWAIGRHAVTAVYAPAAGVPVTPSRASKAFDVLRAAVTWTVSIPRGPIFGGNTALNVWVHGPKVAPATVTLKLGSKVIQKLSVPSSGLLKFRPMVTWNAGNTGLTLSYSGNTYNAPSNRPVVVRTAKAPSTLALSAPSTLGYAIGGVARVGISSAGTKATGVVTLLIDGKARSTARLAAGTASLTIPAMSAGKHTITASYPGDTNHGTAVSSKSITAASTPCPVTARACVDLTTSTTWLQSGGKITYGPVSMASGRPGYRTYAGTFTVYWKDINHHSSEFNNAPMPYAVFFDGGIAFHEGSIYIESHGCVHLTQSAAVTYWNALHVGDQVYVYGYAPY